MTRIRNTRDELKAALAINFSATLEHHLFDALYHALALDTGATLVTADTHYQRRAAHLGGIVLPSEL